MKYAENEYCAYNPKITQSILSKITILASLRHKFRLMKTQFT